MSYNLAKINFIYFCTRFHFYIHIYALILQRRGLSLLQISTIESVVIATLFCMEVPTGVIADRLARKWSITLSVLLLACGETLFLFSRSFPLYPVVAVLTGTGFAFASGATESLIYDSLPAENRDALMKQATSRYGSIGQFAFFLSPIIGSFIVGDLAPERVNTAIALTALALFIGLCVSLTLREPATPYHAQKPNSLAILRDGLAQLRGNRQLQRIALLSILTTPFTGVLVTTFAAPYLTQNAVPPLLIGLALSIGSLLAAFTQRYAYRLEAVMGARRALLILTLLPGISYLVLAALAGPIPSWLLITWMYATNDMRSPLLSAYQNALITTSSRATTLSLMSMLLSLFVAVMGPVYAALGTQSLALAFIVMGGVIIVAGTFIRIDIRPKTVENQLHT